MKINYAPFCLRIDEELHEKVKVLAFEHRKSMNFIMCQAVREFLIKHGNNDQNVS